MRTAFERLIAEKALSAISELENRDLVDFAIESGELEPIVKNLCTKIPIPMSDKIDQICDLLSISKRRFCEMAFSDAIQKAETIMKQEGLYEAYEAAYPNKEEKAE